MIEVTKEEFYRAIGPQNIQGTVEGRYPYTWIAKTPHGYEVGRSVSTTENGVWPIRTQYFLSEAGKEVSGGNHSAKS